MNMERPFRVCWTRQQATSIFVTEALEGDDAVFLATHTPITGFDVAGRDAAEFVAHDEQAVLDVLSEPDRRHAFCVVQGEPGSGKSHLVRWLSVNWPEGQDIKLLLRRADGSLQGALQQLRDRLPPEFHELFEGLGVRQRAGHQGRANNFLSTLANTVDPGHYDDRMVDEAWCERFRPGDILGHPQVKARWQGPSRILRLLEGGGGERNSASASFDAFDVAELVEIVRPFRQMLGSGAKDLVRRLEVEADVIAEHREAKWLAADLAAEQAQQIALTLQFVSVLNRRRNDAIQNVLGVSAQGLKTLFRKVRQALQTRGQRLVLLLEDITSWEGLDDSLIDVLVFNAEARGDEDEVDVCPLISVVGITPNYYDKLLPNYRQRITHEIQLGKSTGQLQDVASLRDPEERVNFVSRYLAAVQVGVPALKAWLTDLRMTPTLAPPNACDACPKRDSCHAVFGSSNGIGLFPFNERALESFFNALKVDDNGQTWRTPRGVLQAVLNPCLSQPDLLDDGQFPGVLIETGAIERTCLPENAVSGRLDGIVMGRIADPQEQARFRRTVTFWGDPESADTLNAETELVFAGVRRSLYDAFDLPWIGAEPSVSAPAVSPLAPPISNLPSIPVPVESVAPEQPAANPVEVPLSQQTTQISAVIRRQEPRSGRVAAPSRNKRTNNQREAMREELRSWAAGRTLENASRWNELIHEVISALDSRLIGVAPFLFQRVVSSEMVKLQGSTSGVRDYLIIPPEDWVRAGLEGVLDLELRRDMSDGDRSFHIRSISTMMRHLERLVVAYLHRRLPLSNAGKLWSPVSALAQVLQARAWLRGVVQPDAPVVDQLRTVLSDEDEALSDPASRSAPWIDWLNATRSWHDRMRIELRSMVSLPLNDGSAGAALVDSSELAGAIARMRERALMDAAPERSGVLPEAMGKARELVEIWNNKRLHIAQTEFAQVRGRTQTLATLLRNRTIEAHLNRLNEAISRTSVHLPNASADQVAAWQKERVRVMPRVAESFARLEDLIVAFDDEETIPTQLPLRFRWLSDLPARQLDEVLGLTQIGEKAIAALYEHAHDCVKEGRQGESLGAVKAIGRELKRVARTGELKRDAA